MSGTVQANKKTVLLAMSEWRLLGLREMVVYAVQAVVMRGERSYAMSWHGVHRERARAAKKGLEALYVYECVMCVGTGARNVQMSVVSWVYDTVVVNAS